MTTSILIFQDSGIGSEEPVAPVLRIPLDGRGRRQVGFHMHVVVTGAKKNVYIYIYYINMDMIVYVFVMCVCVYICIYTHAVIPKFR